MLNLTERASILCAEFEWDGQVQVRLCDANTDITLELASVEDTYLSDPKLTYEAEERSGALDDEDGKLTTGLGLDFVKQASSGRAFPPIRVRVFEVLVDAVDAASVQIEKLYWDYGLAKVLEINPEGSAGTALWTIQNPKSQASAILPLTCDDICINRFGSGKVCEFDIDAAKESGTLTVVNENTLTITGLSAQPIDWWTSGYIEALGYRLRIVNFDGATEFVTLELPPAAWTDVLPLAVTVEPGCRKTRLDCALYEQESNFLGLGIAMEKRNPLFQLPR